MVKHRKRARSEKLQCCCKTFPTSRSGFPGLTCIHILHGLLVMSILSKYISCFVLCTMMEATGNYILTFEHDVVSCWKTPYITLFSVGLNKSCCRLDLKAFWNPYLLSLSDMLSKANIALAISIARKVLSLFLLVFEIYLCCKHAFMLASPAHLYMPRLFTHCLPTIICVMLMSIAFLFFLIYATFLCDSILDCLLWMLYFWLLCFDATCILCIL